MSKIIKIGVAIALLASGSIATCLVFAGEQGHYSSMPMGVRDTAMPPKGFYVTAYDLYYGSGTFKDRDGKEFKSLSTTGTATRDITVFGQSVPVTVSGNLTADFDINLNAFNQLIALTWASGTKILGADYALMILPSWGYTNVDIKATSNAAGTITAGKTSKTFSANSTATIHDENTGFGDLYVQPLWLDWRGKHYDVGVSYGVWCPTGFYDKDNIANVGTGFLTQQIQASVYYYPFDSQGTAIMFRPTYEWNSKKIDENVQPGQVATIEYGISQYVHPRIEVGVMGYNVWQVTEDHGSAAANKGVLDRVNGYGALITCWVIQNKFSVTGKFNQEYLSRDRFEGTGWSINGTWIW